MNYEQWLDALLDPASGVRPSAIPVHSRCVNATFEAG
jgi:hypothetical protein